MTTVAALARRTAIALFAVAFVDEFASGVLPASAPELARDLALSPGLAAGGTVAAFHLLSLVVETPVLAWADRGRVRTVLVGSLLGVALVALFAALAPGPLTLLAALALYGPASGCALAAAEGALVESQPHARERTMTRLTLAGVAGDFAVPALLAVLSGLGLGWRAAMGATAATALALALVSARDPGLDRPMASAHHEDPDEVDEVDDEDAEGPRPPLRELAHTLRGAPSLLAWSLAGVAISLLDEVLVAFSAVHLEAHAGASARWRAAAVAAWTVGNALGLLATERVLTRARPRRILLASSAVTALALAALALARTPLTGALALACVGAAASTFHPLAKAQAYAALPGRPALVNAVAALLLPLEALAPLALAAVATGLGSSAAVLALLVGPLTVGFAALRASSTARDP